MLLTVDIGRMDEAVKAEVTQPIKSEALEKRPVSSEALDAAVVHICQKLRSLGVGWILSRACSEPSRRHT